MVLICSSTVCSAAVATVGWTSSSSGTDGFCWNVQKSLLQFVWSPKTCDGPFLKSWCNWVLFLVTLCLVIAILAPTVSLCIAFFIIYHPCCNILDLWLEDQVYSCRLCKHGLYTQSCSRRFDMVAISNYRHIPQSIHLFRHGESFSNDTAFHGCWSSQSIAIAFVLWDINAFHLLQQHTQHKTCFWFPWIIVFCWYGSWRLQQLHS